MTADDANTPQSAMDWARQLFSDGPKPWYSADYGEHDDDT